MCTGATPPDISACIEKCIKTILFRSTGVYCAVFIEIILIKARIPEKFQH